MWYKDDNKLGLELVNPPQSRFIYLYLFSSSSKGRVWWVFIVNSYIPPTILKFFNNYKKDSIFLFFIFLKFYYK